MRHQVMTNQTWRLALAASAFLSVAVAVAWDASGRIEALWPVRNVIAHDVAGILRRTGTHWQPVPSATFGWS
ncbi:MAG: hypothetical protein EBY11_13070 [Proteobacteria bacterium]|nr:hypothetical protein [Pseudomonadota bacterium]